MPSRGEALGRLAEIVGGSVVGDSAAIVRDVTHDSRQVIAGGLFVAVRGGRVDGHDFAELAVRAGATALMVDHALPLSVPQLVVPDTRMAMAAAAAAVHGHPSRLLRLVGVTGTNGKTTSTFMVESIARAAGDVTGLIGTVVTRMGDTVVPNVRTTPEASDFQRMLGLMVEAGVSVVSAEVSSHALALGRVDSTWFEVAAFTNLSPDHLDFHADMEDYFAVKASLFREGRAGTAVINIDDAHGRRLLASISVPALTVGRDADLSAEVVGASPSSLSLDLRFPDGTDAVCALPLGGRFNAENALVAAGCGLALGYSPQQVVSGLETAPQIPGRFEIISGDRPYTVIVDYAHTPAGIAAVIDAIHSDVQGRLVVVVGAGGDRDRSKRPQMGSAAAEADVVIVTSDNPRSESPDAIIEEVMSGIDSTRHPIVEPDRGRAIEAAVAMARPGDVIMILGKGHERGQEIGGRVLAFDDRAVGRAALERRGE